MTRTLPRLLTVIAFLILTNCNLLPAPVHKIVHAATSADAIVLAVLSDHYNDEAEFGNDVQNFITYGLLAHPYYSNHAAKLQVESFYQPVVGESTFGFNVEVASQNCQMSWIDSTGSDDTATRIQTIVAGINPKHTIVVGDHPYSLGCTDGEWTYVGVGAIGSDVLPHEMGHGLAALRDEWIMFPQASHPGLTATNGRNCFDTRNGTTTPTWSVAGPDLIAGAGSIQGCDLYEVGVVHGFDYFYDGHHYCLMGATHNAEFCPVCARLMDAAFGYTTNSGGSHSSTQVPSPPPNTPANPNVRPPVSPAHKIPGPATRKPAETQLPSGVRIVRAAFVVEQQAVILQPGTVMPIVRLLVAFNPQTGALTAKKAFPITARYASNHQRLGDYLYEVVDGTQTIDVGVLPSSLFTSHNYQGGPIHQTSPPHTTNITLQLPAINSDILNSPTHSVAVRIYRLTPSVTEKVITPAEFSKMRDDKNLVVPLGVLTTAQIKAVM